MGLQLGWGQESESPRLAISLEVPLPHLEALVLPVMCGVRDGF